MTYNWAAFIDHAIDENTVLKRLSGEYGRGAEYVGGDGKSLIRILPADTEDAQAQLDRWRLAAGLSQPNLHRIHRAGAADLDEFSVIYCVCEPIEDRLGDVLGERPLTAEEAADVLPAVASALEYLHMKGIAHRAVRPSSIIAADSTVKLAADSLSPDGSTARDMRDFGTAVVEMLTQERVQDASSVPRGMPSPYREIALGCLQADEKQRWDIARVREVLENGLPEEPVELPVVAHPPKREPESRRRMPVAAMAVAALALIAFAVWFLRRPDRVVIEAHPTVAQRDDSIRPSPVAKAPLVREPAATSPAVQEPKATPPPVQRSRTTSGTGQWGIIAAAYGSYEAAEKRAASLRSKMPDLEPEVFPAKGEGRSYYVLLGSGMTRSDAEARLRRARSSGAPRDAYVTRIDR